jgi:hypothetical protein
MDLGTQDVVVEDEIVGKDDPYNVGDFLQQTMLD